MTQEQIGNELIAKFMGNESIIHSLKKDGNWDDKFSDLIYREDIKYHSSWDWLMDVVEKIENLTGEDGRGEVNYIVTIERRYCVVTLGGEEPICEYSCDDPGLTKTEIVYSIVVEFITWYKQQTQSNDPGK